VDNLSNLIEHGFDCISISPGPETWRLLMHKGFVRHSNWARSTELALFSSVPRLAIAYQIPLVWWGENSALQLGELSVMGAGGADGNNLRNMNTLGGGDVSWLLDASVGQSQILQYMYPSVSEMQKAKIRICFLGYFWRDWSSVDNANFSALRGLEIRRQPPWEIGDLYGVSSLDEDWVSLNQMIKYLKFGFGRVTDFVNEEIRNGRLSREDAIRLAQLYDGKCSEDCIESFSNYIGISVRDFWERVDAAVNVELFEKISVGVYRPKFLVG